MFESCPWDDISVPSQDINTRKVNCRLPVECFWGRDQSGGCNFIIELEGDHLEYFRRNRVLLNGIQVDLRFLSKGKQHLLLTLHKHVDRDIFNGLCRSLLKALEASSDSASALEIIMNHVKRWKIFLSGRLCRLSKEEVQGLFSEVTFLKELINRNALESNDAIDSWFGPERSHQDFIFSNFSVEVKSITGRERSTVRISSEDQLESVSDSLFLVLYRLSNDRDHEDCCSLNGRIEEVRSILTDADSLENFDRKLSLYGYSPLPEYDDFSFLVHDIKCYSVTEGFPRLTRSELPSGVINCSYDIKIELLDNYVISEEIIFGEL